MNGHFHEYFRWDLTAGIGALGAFVITLSTAGIATGADRQSPGHSVPSSQAVPLKGQPVPAPLPSVTVPTIQSLSLPQHFDTDATHISSELDALVKEAVRNNPDLAAARFALAASEARVPQAGMPSDPKIGYFLKDMPTTFSFTRESATQQQAIIQQHYPFPGKLTLREEAAGKQAEVTREQLHLATLALITKVRSAFDDIFIIDKDLELALQEREMLRGFVEIATAKYKVGPGLQQDILNADVALSRLDSSLIELARKRKTREIRLAVLLNRDSVQISPLGALPPAELKHTKLELQQMGEEMNPEIRARARAVERDQLQLKLAQKAVLPDFDFAFAYGDRQNNILTGSAGKKNFRPDLLRAQILFNVPIFYYYKQREEVIEAEAKLSRDRSRLEAARRSTIAGLLDLLARLAQYEQVALYFRQEVIPLAQTAVAASTSAYQVDKVDFLTLLTAQEKLEKYEIEYWRNEAERYRTLAQIDEVTGGALVEGRWTK